MFTKIQAIIPIEGPKWAEEHKAQIDVNGDTGTIEILCQNHEIVDHIFELADKGYDFKVEISAMPKDRS